MKMIFRVKLKQTMPLFYKGVPTWYDAGELFDVLEEKALPALKEPFYRLQNVRWGVEIDGFSNPDSFEKVSE